MTENVKELTERLERLRVDLKKRTEEKLRCELELKTLKEQREELEKEIKESFNVEPTVEALDAEIKKTNKEVEDLLTETENMLKKQPVARSAVTT